MAEPIREDIAISRFMVYHYYFFTDQTIVGVSNIIWPLWSRHSTEKVTITRPSILRDGQICSYISMLRGWTMYLRYKGPDMSSSSLCRGTYMEEGCMKKKLPVKLSENSY